MAEPELLGVYFDPEYEYPWRVMEIDDGKGDITLRRVDNAVPFMGEWTVTYEQFEGSWHSATWDPTRQLWMAVSDDEESLI